MHCYICSRRNNQTISNDKKEIIETTLLIPIVSSCLSGVIHVLGIMDADESENFSHRLFNFILCHVECIVPLRVPETIT